MKHLFFVCFFHFIDFVCVQTEKNERESVFQLSRFFNELREEAERERFCFVLFSLRVSLILFFLILFYLRRKNKTETHTQEEKIYECFLYFLFDMLNYADEKCRQLEKEETNT